MIIHEIQSFFDPVNKKVIGKMKDEFKAKMINEFIGLKSKMYSSIAVNVEKLKKKMVSTKMLLKA